MSGVEAVMSNSTERNNQEKEAKKQFVLKQRETLQSKIKTLTLDTKNRVVNFLQKYLLGKPPEDQKKVVESSKERKEEVTAKDLTCNAMALDLHTKKVYGTGPKGSAVDNVIDIKDKTIRFVGNGLDRIKEDRLRALRAIRFAVRMGAQLHPEAKQAIKDAVDQGLIVIPSEQLSGERVRNELISTLGYKDGRRAIRMYQDTGLLYAMFPELKPAETQYQNKHHGDVMVLEHILRTVEAVDEMPKGDYSIFTPFSTILTGKRVEDVTDDDRANTARGLLRFTMLMHDIAKPTVAADLLYFFIIGEFCGYRHNVNRLMINVQLFNCLVDETERRIVEVIRTENFRNFHDCFWINKQRTDHRLFRFNAMGLGFEGGHIREA
jgi:hypothetical protein